MGKLEKLIRSPTNLLVGAACIVTILMMVHVVADVTSRYLFAYQIEGTIEVVAGYYMVAIVFLPLAYVASHEGHIIVELFTRGMSERGLARFDGVVGIVTFLFMCLFAWMTFEEALAQTLEGEVVQTSDDVIIIWPSRWFLPLGCAVMAAYVLVQSIQDLIRARASRK